MCYDTEIYIKGRRCSLVQTLIEVLLIALSLAMDAMAVSISAGLACKGSAVKVGLRLGAWFGAFQFAMPLIGFALGQAMAAYVEAVAPYIAFALLAFIGGRMVWDAVAPGSEDEDMSTLSNKKVCLLAIATSIDALAVGVGAAMMEMPLLASCVIIGVVAFALSFLGAVVGRRLGQRFNRWAQAAGGVVLIGIGLKFLLERLFF